MTVYRFALAIALVGWSLPTSATRPLTMGVTTHFGQGWPSSYWALLERIPAKTVRDGASWRLIESERGRHAYTPQNTGHIERICAMGRKVVLGLEPRHPLYDNGQTIFSAVGRQAFAAYVASLANRFGRCLIAVEIGNEINARNTMTGPASLNRAKSHTELVGAVRATLKAEHSDVAVLGGSVNSVATGFLATFFEAGLLGNADGIAIHPYRQEPANLDLELTRLNEAMEARGPVRPVWATEFSNDFASPDEAAPFLLKMAALMSASGVEHAQWYALVDQPGFPTMGLFTRQGMAKPAADAFTYFANELASRGPAIKMNAGQRGVHHYRFGTDRHVVWGTARPVHLGAGFLARNAAGKPLPRPERIDDQPLILEGAGPISFGESAVLADSLEDFARQPWTYFGGRPGKPQLRLQLVDWTWTSFLGDPTLRPSAINQAGLTVAGDGRNGVRLTLRFTATQSANAFASACLRKTLPNGDGLDFTLSHNGTPLARRIIGPDEVEIEQAVRLQPGDRIDFTFGPNVKAGNDALRHRLRIALSRKDVARC